MIYIVNDKTYKAKIKSVSRKQPVPKYLELDFVLEISEGTTVIIPDYNTTLAFVYEDDVVNGDTTEFFKIDSETGNKI